MAQQKMAVIGLGHFGLHLALRLTEQGVEVLGVDISDERVEKVRDRIAHAMVLDSTDARALAQIGIADFDTVIVAIGDHFEASLLTSAHLQELKVKRIINRVLSPVHERILKLMNINELIVPEGEAAAQLARRLAFSGVLEHFDISADFSIVEVPVPSWAQGKTLEELNLRKKHHLNLITVLQKEAKSDALLTEGRKARVRSLGVPEAGMRFSEKDILVVFGENNHIQDFLNK